MHTSIEHCDLETRMCNTKPDASEQILYARTILLRLQSVVAKHNARIRLRYPQSHPVRVAVEKYMSGTINDMPSPIHIFIQSAEDAACIHENELGVDPLEVFTDGLSELVDDARAWAGDIAMSDLATPMYPKALSMVDEHLFQEIATNARGFFAAVRTIPGVNVTPLAKVEAEFWNKYKQAGDALSRATKDHSVAIQTRVLLSLMLPAPIAEHVLYYLCA